MSSNIKDIPCREISNGAGPVRNYIAPCKISNGAKILFVRTDRVGDVLLNAPALRALAQTYPRAKITVIVAPQVEEVLRGNPFVDEVILNYGRKVLLFWKLCRKGFDAMIVSNPSKGFHLLGFLAGIPRRVGYGRKWGFLLTDKLEDKKYLGQKHEVDYNLDLVGLIGAHTKDRALFVPYDMVDERRVGALLEGEVLPIAAIHPWTSDFVKQWPIERFAEVANRLEAELGVRVALIGGEEELRAAKEFVTGLNHPVLNFCGRLSWRELAAFFKRCKMLISNDSAPVHIASAVALSTIVIFGRSPAHLRRWAPIGENHRILYKDVGCSPCLDHDCPYDLKCLKAISADEVICAAKKILKV